MVKEQYIQYRISNNLLPIMWEYYKEKTDKFLLTFEQFNSIFPEWIKFNSKKIIEATISYYNVKFNITEVEKDGKIVQII